MTTMFNAVWYRIRPLLLSLLVLLTSGVVVVVGPASPAHADPSCQSNGYYVLWARGSGEMINDARAQAFGWRLAGGLGSFEWAELGNLDGTAADGEQVDDTDHEYPARRVDGWHLVGAALFGYNNSVQVGVRELVAHLNDRYAGDGPEGNGACHSETLILGGYSQGADVIGSALERQGIAAAAKDNIGFVALYGDPKFNPGALSDRYNRVNFHSDWWWVRGDDAGFRFTGAPILPEYKVPNSGILQARDPYVPGEFKGRFGSWCAYNDLVCAGTGTEAVHSTKYQDNWIEDSVDEIVYEARKKHDQLDPSNPHSNSSFTVSMPNSLPATYGAPPPATIHTLKRTKDPGGTNQVYAATRSAVTEAWWQPGGDGVHVKEMIHISQNNIVGFDKVNEPDGATQSLYTAVPDGVWETWWRPNEGIHSEKIVTGLSGVRQVIADPRWENGQYVHRLYLLAQDGPYEVWWRDGDPSGIHVNRLNQINDPVTMTASTGPSGEYQLYVATATWAYELWWYPGQGMHYGPVINVTQANIDSLSKITFSAGQQRLYTGTSTGVWQSVWQNSTPAHNHEVSGKTGVVHSEAMKPGSAFQIYLATGTSVQEYWWTTTNAGNSTLMSRSQGDITTFDKYNDSSYQQVYTATLYGQVYETYWGGGTGPTTKLLFTVGR